MPAAGNYVIRVTGHGRIAYARSYLEYDFTVSDGGWTASSGTWVAVTGWVGANVDPDPDGGDRMWLQMAKTLRESQTNGTENRSKQSYNV